LVGQNVGGGGLVDGEWRLKRKGKTEIEVGALLAV
jgi:hypothetical protein